MNELVCLDLPLGTQFIDRLSQAWVNGDAIFPLDQRLPPAMRLKVLDTIKPTVIVGSDGEESYDGQLVQDGDAVVVATSGTTGAPKGVVLTHEAVRASATATSSRLNVTTDDCWFACLPVSHIGGLSVVLRSIITNTRLITAPSFSTAAYLSAAKSGATMVSLVATAMQQVDTSLFRTILLGGAAAPEQRPLNSVTTYGMTETGSGVVYDGIPLEGVEVEIRDNVIFLRAPMLLRNYRDGSSPLHNGWLRTGDIGHLDAKGKLHVQGREGDLIITGGENVWPQQVEDAIRSMAAVQDVCVAGVADAKWGHAVHAWIVTSDDTSLQLDQVRDAVKQTLPSFCAPQKIHFIQQIPHTALGKPMRNELINSVEN